MNNLKVSKKYFVDVYSFMEMCGLKCNKKKNIRISHKIMLRKLALRHNLFPSEVVVPKNAPFYTITKEDILKGNIIIVEDEYKNRLAFFNPTRHLITKKSERTETEKQMIRDKIIEEYLKEQENKNSEFSTGYINYLVKKAKKDQEEREEYYKEELKQNVNEEFYNDMILYQKRLTMYNRRGFGRR